MAHLAGDVHVRQKVHLDLQQTVAGASLAPAATGIEGEAPRPVATGLGLLRGGKKIAYVVEEIGVGGGVGAGRAADGALVDAYHLVQILQSLHGGVLAGVGLHAVQLGAQPLIDDLVDQRGLAAAGDAGDAGEGPQRHGDVDVFQVILPCAPHRQELPIAGAAGGRHLDALFPAEVLARQAIGIGHDLLRRAGGHHLPAVGSGAGADVDEVVGGPHGVLVVLHHNEGIAQIPQAAEGSQQLVVVPLVQADGGLVQNIQHPHQAAADLRGQPDTLALAAGQGTAGTGQGQVAEAHRLQKAQPGADLLQDLCGDELLRLRQGQAVEEGQLLIHRQLRSLPDGQATHRHRQRLRLQAAALTGRAGALGHELLDLPLAGVGLSLLIPTFQIVGHPLEGLI